MGCIFPYAGTGKKWRDRRYCLRPLSPHGRGCGDDEEAGPAGVSVFLFVGKAVSRWGDKEK